MILYLYSWWCNYPEVVEGGVGDALSSDVLGELVQHARVLLRVQPDHRARH